MIFAGGLGNNAQEILVSKMEIGIWNSAVSAGLPVVLDNTNLRAKIVKEWLHRAQKAGYEVEFKDFPITREQALYRDALRASKGERYVGPEVIHMFFSKFVGPSGALPLIPTIDSVVSPIFKPYVDPKTEDSCIIVDIDGTLAHMTGRSPYDTSRYHEDAFDETIAFIVQSYSDVWHHVVLMSGRDERYREVTEKWLNRHGFDFDHLYMRPAHDTRNDAIVKDELFETHIAGKYTVDYVLDDRDRVVKMWRAKGLKCLQVADGDF
jgi:hypothetical protein